jgi:hypothetical protein
MEERMMADEFAEAIMAFEDDLARACHQATERGVSDKELATELREYARRLEED